MHRNLIDDGAADRPVPVNSPFFQTSRYRTVMRAEMQVVVSPQEHGGIVGIAKLAGTLDNSLKGWSNNGRRGCDHLKNVAAPGLIDQRLGQVAGLCLQLIEQSRILNR